MRYRCTKKITIVQITWKYIATYFSKQKIKKLIVIDYEV